MSAGHDFWLPLAIVSALFFVVLPGALFLALAAVGDQGMAQQLGDVVNAVTDSVPAQARAGGPSIQVAYALAIYLFGPLDLIVPLTVASAIGSHTIIGERESGSGEFLAHSPASENEIFVGKLPAGLIPGCATAAIGFGFYSLVMNTILGSGLGGWFFPTPGWWLMIACVLPLFLVLEVVLVLRVSARVSGSTAARQASAAERVRSTVTLTGKRGSRLLYALVGLVLSGVFMVSCAKSDREGHDAAGGPTSTSTSSTEAGVSLTDRPYSVRRLTETFIDTSRATEDPLGVLDAPDRTLKTDLYVPEVAAPVPLIILAHGLNGNPDKLSDLATGWAEAGYVVAAPLFPLTNDLIEGQPRIPDYVNQPGDVSFVIDEMLRLSNQASSPLSQRVDPERIGVSGLSLGAGTTYGVAFNSCCIDSRIDAVLLMSPYRFPYDGEYHLEGVPAMWVHGDSDARLPYSDSVAAYAQAAPPKIFVTLVGGSHSDPFENVPDPHDAVVAAVTLDFWDAYLGGDPDAVARLVAHGDVPGIATVVAEP